MGKPFICSDRRILLAPDLRDRSVAEVAPGVQLFCAILGYIAEPFGNPAIVRFYLGGMQYALGDLEGMHQ